MVIAIKRVLFCLLLDYKKKLWNMERQDGRRDTKASENISRVSAENNFSTQEEKLRISKRPCNVILIIKTPMKYQTISHLYIFLLRKARFVFVAVGCVKCACVASVSAQA